MVEEMEESKKNRGSGGMFGCRILGRTGKGFVVVLSQKIVVKIPARKGHGQSIFLFCLCEWMLSESETPFQLVLAKWIEEQLESHTISSLKFILVKNQEEIKGPGFFFRLCT